MERLAGVEEILDGPLDDLDAVAGNLRDLGRVNRLLGGTRLSRLAIARLWPDGTSLSVVDVGTGGADIPVSLLADAARHGRSLRVEAIDSRPEVIEAARLARPAVDGITGLSLRVADGLALPYPDGAFDVAHCSMVVHHLEPADAVTLLREMARVARLGVVVNDLVRGRLFWAGAWVMSHGATRNRLTRNDAPLSVRRAFSRAELRALVAEAGLEVVAEIDGAAWHRVAIAATPAMTDVDVVVVGGGPAGAVSAALLARRGRRVVLLERAPAYRWRACGVFASPASVVALRGAGLDEAAIARAARPIPAMRVETAAGASFRLTYGDGDRLAAPAVGFDRLSLDPSLLALAREAGADVRLGVAVTAVARGDVTTSSGEIRTRVVVGADGLRSVVARGFGVARPARLASRVGLTFHVADPRPDMPRDARMVLFDGGYVGLAPVPGGRVNVGIVLGGQWLERLRRDGAESTVEAVLAAIPPARDDPVDWRSAARCDPIEGAAPLGVRATHRAGDGWLLVGDAAGFLDPFTGEGLHRALVSARLAATAVDRALDGDTAALAGYDRAMTGRFRSKDALSLLVQAFLARPAVFDHAARRLAARDEVRETMGLVMGDLVPASQALDPRFIAALLRP